MSNNNLPEKLRKLARTRRDLGGNPCGYEFLFEAADEIERLRSELENQDEC